jgi:hypothetical protein
MPLNRGPIKTAAEVAGVYRRPGSDQGAAVTLRLVA